MKLPVMDGWVVLDRLKHHPETRHIPVHIVSAGDGRQNALKAGAVAFLEKPISKEGLEDTFGEIRNFIDRGLKRLLVVEDDEGQRQAVVELIGSDEDVEVTAVGTGEAALEVLGPRALRLHGARPQAARHGAALPSSRSSRKMEQHSSILRDRLHRERSSHVGRRRS